MEPEKSPVKAILRKENKARGITFPYFKTYYKGVCCVCVCVYIERKSLSHVWLFVNPLTVACQAPQSMEFPARILEWVAISFSRGSSYIYVCVLSHFSRVWLFVTLWTTVHQLPCVFVCVCSVVSSFLQPQENYSPPGSIVRGILQARILEWAVISFPREPSRSRDLICVSCISCIGRYILYQYATLEIPIYVSIFMPVLTNTE